MIGIVEDSRRLTARNDSLRTMAEVTDGIAVVQNGDLSAGMRRIVEDLSSYYLLGYYSTRELDGKFHRLTVRVKRPGVRVRARTGYLAATRGDEAKAKAEQRRLPRPNPSTPGGGGQGFALDARDFFERASAARACRYWVSPIRRSRYLGGCRSARHDRTTRLDRGRSGRCDAHRQRRPDDSHRTAHDRSRSPQREIHIRLAHARSFRATTRCSCARKVLLRRSARWNRFVCRSPQHRSRTGRSFCVAVSRPATSRCPLPICASVEPNGSVVEIPTTSTDAGTAQLLNRAGQAMTIPITCAIREDADGSRWRTAQLALAPLAPGDYVVEQSAGAKIAHRFPRSAVRREVASGHKNGTGASR